MPFLSPIESHTFEPESEKRKKSPVSFAQLVEEQTQFDPSVNLLDKSYLIPLFGAHWFTKQLDRSSIVPDYPRQVSLLELLIKENEATWVTKKLENVSLDLSHTGHVELLNLLAYKGQSEWVIQKLENLKTDVVKELSLLKTLAIVGQAKWVTEQLTDFRFNFEISDHFYLFVALAEHGQALWLTKQLDQLNISLDIPLHQRLIAHLMDNGQQTWVREQMEKRGVDIIDDDLFKHFCFQENAKLIVEMKRRMFDVKNNDDLLILQQFAKLGQTAFVKTQIEDKKWNPTKPAFIGLLTILIEQGEGEWVVHLFDAFNAMAQKSVIPSRPLLVSLLEYGQKQWVLKKLSQATFNLYNSEDDNSDDVELLTAIMKQGEQKWVENLFQDSQLNLDREDHNAFIKFLIRTGDVAWVIKKLDQYPFKEWHSSILKLLIQHGEADWVKLQLQNRDDRDPLFYKIRGLIYFEKDDLTHFTSMKSRNIETSKKALAHWKQEQEQDLLLRFLENATSLKKNFNIPESVISQMEDRIQLILKHLPAHFLPFFKLAINRHGWFDPHILRAIDAITTGNKSFVIDLQKSGSRLQIYGKPRKKGFSVGFVNDIPSENTNTWVDVHKTDIPVAPIVQTPKTLDEETTRVYSRYCGMSFDQLKQTVTDYSPEFVRYLRYKQETIIEKIEAQGIKHGHPHEGNFTVEFVQKAWLKEQMEQHGKTINTFPVDEEHVSFDPMVFLEHPDEWTAVVRLIDWDAAQSSKSSGS